MGRESASEAHRDLRPHPRGDVGRSRFGRLLGVCGVLLVFGLFLTVAIPYLLHVVPPSHDRSVLRAFAMGTEGVLRALDAPLSVPFRWMPVGNMPFRLSMASLAFAVLALLGFAFLGKRLEPDGTRFSGPIRWIALLVAAFSAGFLREATAPVGSSLGLFVVVLPLVVAELLRASSRDTSSQVSLFGKFWLFFFAALATGYDPLLGGAASLLVLGSKRFIPLNVREFLVAGTAVSFGSIPLVWSCAVAGASQEPFSHSPRALLLEPIPYASGFRSFWFSEVGTVWGAMGVLGAVLALSTEATRRRVFPLAALWGVSGGVVALANGVSEEKSSSASLFFVLSTALFAAFGTSRLVEWIANAKLPYARLSAAMSVVLLSSRIAIGWDDAGVALDARTKALLPESQALALAPLLSRSAIFASDDASYRHLLALEVTHPTPREALLLSLKHLGFPRAKRALEIEPALFDLVHDVVLKGEVTEHALATLAGSRTVYVSFDPRWEKAIARHIVADGLYDRYHPEPRGPSDRKQGNYEAAAASRLVVEAFGNGGEGETRAFYETRLLHRIAAFAALGDKENCEPILAPLLRMPGETSVAREIARRLGARPAKWSAPTSVAYIDMMDLTSLRSM